MSYTIIPIMDNSKINSSATEENDIRFIIKDEFKDTVLPTIYNTEQEARNKRNQLLCERLAEGLDEASDELEHIYSNI